jgi:hypothetical protein
MVERNLYKLDEALKKEGQERATHDLIHALVKL